MVGISYDYMPPVAVRRELQANKKHVQAITEYWEDMGHKVKLYLVLDESRGMYSIKSDLKNGLPTDKPLTPLAYNRLLI